MCPVLSPLIFGSFAEQRVAVADAPRAVAGGQRRGRCGSRSCGRSSARAGRRRAGRGRAPRSSCRARRARSGSRSACSRARACGRAGSSSGRTSARDPPTCVGERHAASFADSSIRPRSRSATDSFSPGRRLSLRLDRRRDVVRRRDPVGELRLLHRQQRGHQLRGRGDRAPLLGVARVEDLAGAGLDQDRRRGADVGRLARRRAPAARRARARRPRARRRDGASRHHRSLSLVPGVRTCGSRSGLSWRMVVERHVGLLGDAGRRVAGLDRCRSCGAASSSCASSSCRPCRGCCDDVGEPLSRRAGIVLRRGRDDEEEGEPKATSASGARKRAGLRPAIGTMIAAAQATDLTAQASAQRLLAQPLGLGAGRVGGRLRRSATCASAIEREALTRPPARPGAKAGASAATSRPGRRCRAAGTACAASARASARGARGRSRR